ncbi:MAG: hypothetical protein WBJ91_04315 [Dethiobacteria bacterium]
MDSTRVKVSWGLLQWPSLCLQKQGILLCNFRESYFAIPGKSSLQQTVWLDERAGIYYLVVWVYISSLSGCSKDLSELVMSLNTYEGVFKCQLVDDVLSACLFHRNRSPIPEIADRRFRYASDHLFRALPITSRSEATLFFI